MTKQKSVRDWSIERWIFTITGVAMILSIIVWEGPFVWAMAFIIWVMFIISIFTTAKAFRDMLWRMFSPEQKEARRKESIKEALREIKEEEETKQ